MNCSHAGNTIVRWITPIKIFISMAMGETIPSTKVPDLVGGFGVENGILLMLLPGGIGCIGRLGTEHHRICQGYDASWSKRCI